MADVSHNHANYQARLDFIEQLLLHNLNLSSEEIKQLSITPIQYEPDFPFRYNNFVYRLSLPASTSSGFGGRDKERLLKQPGCLPIPSGTMELIVRLSNSDAEGMHQETRVHNEVAMLTLASAALQHIKPHVVPRVFGWGAVCQENPGWILQEFMPGVPLAEPFSETMSLDQKKGILSQMAALLKGLQDYPLPQSIKGWGGVSFDESGAIVSAAMSSVGAGPWYSLEDSYRDRLKIKLALADKNPNLDGWRAHGVRERIDAFIERGLPAQFSGLESKQDRAIIHADFTPDNLLYDPSTGCITGLLDYDFSSILHPGYEYFRSFSSNGGQLTGCLGSTTAEEKEAEALRNAKLTGEFPSPLPAPLESANGPGTDWELAEAWENELQSLDVNRPSKIRGIDKIADVDEVLGSLLPWRLTNEDFLRMNQDEDQTKAFRHRSEKQLVGLLDYLGF